VPPTSPHPRRIRGVLALAALLVGVLAAVAALTLADEREGTAQADRIEGTDNADVLTGLDGDDELLGKGGDDRLDGGGDSDRVDGGAGDDLVVGAGCFVGDYGRLCDNPGREVLRGGPGDDDVRASVCVTSYCAGDRYSALDSELDGGSGEDRVTGGSGHDRMVGGPGPDRLRGLAGNDRIWGGSGGDRIVGGAGRDRLAGDAGNDRIDARDGLRDRVLCGKGRDITYVDRRDTVRGCETVRRRR
jgi:Ca2+-binding RTX toxin-like protein